MATQNTFHKFDKKPFVSPEADFAQMKFQPNWIINGTDPSLIEFSDNLGKYLKDNKLTTSKIRNIYGEVKRIQIAKNFEVEKVSFYLLKPKVAYALGRDESNNGLKMFKLLFDECYKYVKDDQTFKNFCNLFEAVLAYHKAYGGKD